MEFVEEGVDEEVELVLLHDNKLVLVFLDLIFHAENGVDLL